MSSTSTKHNLFTFKRFSLSHSHSAMKIGTDGVLLGSWAMADGGEKGHILDVGCGCGLTSLMIAQRFPSHKITGIDIDDGAIHDARENVRNSPWSDRVEVVEGDFFHFNPSVKYDMILSNPPFFSADVHSPTASRDAARSALSFPIEAFASRCHDILSPTGSISIIYPYTEKERVIYSFYSNGLYLNKVCYVKDNPSSSIIRVMMSFSHNACNSPLEEHLTIREDEKNWSEDYKKLTRDFHPQL